MFDFFARKFLPTYLWSISNRFVQNAAHSFFSPPLGKRLNFTEEYEGLSLVDTSFAPRDSSKKLAMSPSSIGHGVQYDTKYLHPGISLD